jgi:hypothetical protein
VSKSTFTVIDDSMSSFETLSTEEYVRKKLKELFFLGESSIDVRFVDVLKVKVKVGLLEILTNLFKEKHLSDHIRIDILQDPEDKRLINVRFRAKDEIGKKLIARLKHGSGEILIGNNGYMTYFPN